jgi:hypothetical protein
MKRMLSISTFSPRNFFPNPMIESLFRIKSGSNFHINPELLPISFPPACPLLVGTAAGTQGEREGIREEIWPSYFRDPPLKM